MIQDYSIQKKDEKLLNIIELVNHIIYFSKILLNNNLNEIKYYYNHLEVRLIKW